MKTYQKRFTLFLVSLFLAFSFNAYACVVPVYNNIPITQGSDCTMPGEEPVSQFCDGFKSLMVQSGADISSSGLTNLALIGNMSSLFPDAVTTCQFLPIPARGSFAPPKDIHVLISVFRI